MQFAERPEIERLLTHWDDASQAVVQEALRIQRIPAPTFAEQERAAYIASRFEKIGLTDVNVDSIGNVYAWSRQPESHGPAVMVSAHLDTVFPQETNLAVRKHRERVYGPGIGDNSLGLAAIISLAEAIQEQAISTPYDIVWVATVGEEGLGDLRGMRQAIDQLGDQIGVAIILEGIGIGNVYNAGLGVRRLRINLKGPGGHSWLHPNRPSAVHHLFRIGAQLVDIPLDIFPKATFNIGLIEGGTSINTRAAQASMSIDMRANDPRVLRTVEDHVRRVVETHKKPKGLTITIDVVGDRPSAKLSDAHPLVTAAQEALVYIGYKPDPPRIASTDANIPLASGIPSVCIGITTGGDAHSTNEYILTSPLAAGMKQFTHLTLQAAHHAEEWSVWQ